MMITTSKRPSGRTRTFGRELLSAIPNAVYVQRGKKNMEAMAKEAYHAGHERIAIIKTRDGNPCGFEFLDTEKEEYVGGMDFTVTLRREMKKEKIRPPIEDTDFFIESEEENAILLSLLWCFPLRRRKEEDLCFAVFKEGTLDFYRLDLGEGPAGPRLYVRNLYGKNHYMR